MSAVHSPGPWVHHHGPRDTMVSINTLDGNEVGGVWCEEWSTKDRGINANVLANARLIAAAPDLLAALVWFINDIDGTHTKMVDFDRNVADARAAIARVEGRT